MNQNAYLIIDGGNRFDLTSERVTVGSADGNGLVIAVDIIDGYHAEFFREGGKWYLRDLNSVNGVWLNGMRVPAGEKLPLMNGDVILLSQALQMVFQEVPQAAVPAVNLNKNQQEMPASSGKNSRVSATKTQNGGKKRKNPLVSVAICVAAALVLVLGWCGAMHFIGNSQLEKGEYDAAISSYGRDFLFSSGCAEQAMLRAGDAALAEGDYLKAQDYYNRLKESGSEKWSDAVYQQALAAQTPEERIEILKQIEDEKRAQEQIGAAQLEMAEALFAEGKYSEAQTLAESIQDRTLADVDAFLDKLWHEVGDKAVREEYDVTHAISCYEKCVQTEVITTQLSILKNLRDKQFTAAANAIKDALFTGKTDFSAGTWKTLYDKSVPERISNSNQYLDYWGGEKILNGEETLDMDKLKKGISENIPTGEIASTSPRFPSSFECESLQELLANSGSNASGKILIIGCARNYPDKKETYAILTKLMDLLPASRYPTGLDEVEYLLVLDYNYSYYHQYDVGTVALHERGNVLTYHLPDGKQTAASTLQYGTKPPNSFRFNLLPPDTKTGEVPDLSDALYKAIEKITK